MKVEKKERLHQRINNAEKRLKDIERIRWSPSTVEEVKERGEEPADFFRIMYKLQVLDKMRRFLDSHCYLPGSYIWMLKHPREPWGDILVRKKVEHYMNPEKLAIKRDL